MKGRSRLLLRVVLALVIIGGLAVGGWMVWTTVGAIGESIESIDLEQGNVGYEPPPTTTTTTTLPPRDLEILVVTADGAPAGAGVEVWIIESTDGEPAASPSAATTDATGAVKWLDMAAASVDVGLATTCRPEEGVCLVPRDEAPEPVTLDPGLTTVELVVDLYDLNRTTTGVLPGNEVWSSEITLTGSVIVPEGFTLIITSGTVVTLSAEDDAVFLESHDPLDKPDGIALWSEGTVVVEGTTDAPVAIVADADEGEWAGLFGPFDASFLDISGGREVRFAELSRVTGATIAAGQISTGAGSRLGSSQLVAESISIAGGAEFDHNTVAAGTTTAGLSGARLHHNEFTGTGQPDCVLLEGLSGHELRNNILIDCPLRAISRPDEQPREDDPPPFVVENNTFVALTRQNGAAVAIDSEFVAVMQGESDPDRLDTVKVFFLNNIVHGPWPEGVYLGARPLRGGSTFKNNAFYGVDPEPQERFDPDNNYTYGGRFDRRSLFSLTGVIALDFSWTRNWSEGARIFDVYDDVQFVDPEGDFHLSPTSPAIDAGYANIRDADGSPSDLGAYGGPGGEDWD